MRIGEPDPIYTLPSSVRKVVTDLSKKHGLTYDQFLVLVYLRGSGQITQSEGKEGAGYNPESFRKLLTSLVDAGLVDVEENTKGENLYYLSSKGDYIVRGYSLLVRRAMK